MMLLGIRVHEDHGGDVDGEPFPVILCPFLSCFNDIDVVIDDDVDFGLKIMVMLV